MELVERLREQASHFRDGVQPELAPLVTEAADLLEEALKALEAICEMQRRRYGDGMRTHMDLIGLCDDARAILTKSQGDKIDG